MSDRPQSSPPESYDRLPKAVRLTIATLLPVILIAAAGFKMNSLLSNKPEPSQRPVILPETRVEATRVKPETYQILLDTRGVVQPQTETTLIPEVSGRITEISPAFRSGGFFDKGDMLLQIDPINYETAVTIAESNLAQARVALEEEKARSSQALQNWRRLNKSGDPSDLVLRKPQLAEAEALLNASEAELKKAKRDVERTTIRAPYNGRIVEQLVDIGQFVSTGTQMAETYAVDTIEVRLPLTNRQLGFVDLPEQYREGDAEVPAPEVLVTTQQGNKSAQWTGKITRVEGMLDERSRQLFVIAEIDDPFAKREDNAPPLKMGLFTDAIVKGREVEDVFVLPRRVLRADNEIVVITPENKIQRTKVEPLWSDRDHVVIASSGSGLNAGDVVCLTPIAYPTNGALVIPTIDGIAPTTEIPGKHPGGWKGKGEKGGKGGKSGSS